MMRQVLLLFHSACTCGLNDPVTFDIEDVINSGV